MKGIMATLTDKQQPLLRAVRLTGKATLGTCLTGKVGVHFDGQAPRKHGFIGNKPVPFSKGPCGGSRIRLALLLTRLLARPAFGVFTDVGQVLKSNDAVWVLCDDALRDAVIGLQLQPSLSSTDRYQATGRGTSAFTLQAFTKSCVVIGCSSHSLARMERCFPSRSRGDGEIASADIDPNHHAMILRCRVCYLKLKAHQQVELFMRFVIPEFSGPDSRSMLEQSRVFVVSRIGHNHAPIKGQDAHLLLLLKRVVVCEIVGERGGNVLRGFIQSLIAFLGLAREALCCILLDFLPQGFVGSPHLTGNITGHLGWQGVDRSYLGIGFLLQTDLIADLAMLKCMTADVIQSITIGQLRATQCHELFRSRMQFEFHHNGLFHWSSVPMFTRYVKSFLCESGGHSSSWLEARGLLAATC